MTDRETAYLTAKRSLDDRALNRQVLGAFEQALVGYEPPVRVLEVGSGTGTMIARLAEWNRLPGAVEYRAIERNHDRASLARERVPEWLAAAGYQVESDSAVVHATDDETDLSVRIETGDGLSVSPDEQVDAVIACAFLDLVEPTAVSTLFDLLVPGGVLYAPITFDGLTGFVPSHPFDEAVAGAYHQHMALREGAGPNAGRRTLERVSKIGEELVAAGGSDWLIHPDGDGYPADERLVLEQVLETITSSVEAVIAAGEAGLTSAELTEWEKHRREQLSAATLTVLAHNLDVLARRVLPE